MKTISPEHLELIQSGQRRGRTHAQCMWLIDAIRKDPSMDNVTFMTSDSGTQAKVYNLFKNQLTDYLVSKERSDNVYVVRVIRPTLN